MACIKIGQGERSIKCHKVVLAARCPYLLEPLRSSSVNADNVEKKLDELRFPDVADDSLVEFVHFLYTDTVSSTLSLPVLLSLIKLSKRFKLATLYANCFRSFSQSLTIDNIEEYRKVITNLIEENNKKEKKCYSDDAEDDYSILELELIEEVCSDFYEKISSGTNTIESSEQVKEKKVNPTFDNKIIWHKEKVFPSVQKQQEKREEKLLGSSASPEENNGDFEVKKWNTGLIYNTLEVDLMVRCSNRFERVYIVS